MAKQTAYKIDLRQIRGAIGRAQSQAKQSIKAGEASVIKSTLKGKKGDVKANTRNVLKARSVGQGLSAALAIMEDECGNNRYNSFQIYVQS